jgi:hypothetical protein
MKLASVLMEKTDARCWDKSFSDIIPVMIPYIYLSTYSCKNISIPLVVNTPNIIKEKCFIQQRR